jgi:hypothetical protein
MQLWWQACRLRIHFFAADIRLKRTTTEKSLFLAAGTELIVLVFEKDIERRERTVTAGDILLQVELVGIA